jgi:anti-sigma factor RsiW
MTTIVCASGVPLLMEYLDGVLPADVAAALEAHVADCPRCTAFFASYVATPRILREATAIDLPPALRQSLRTKLRERQQELRGRLDN